MTALMEGSDTENLMKWSHYCEDTRLHHESHFLFIT